MSPVTIHCMGKVSVCYLLLVMKLSSSKCSTWEYQNNLSLSLSSHWHCKPAKLFSLICSTLKYAALNQFLKNNINISVSWFIVVSLIIHLSKIRSSLSGQFWPTLWQNSSKHEHHAFPPFSPCSLHDRCSRTGGGVSGGVGDVDDHDHDYDNSW